MLTRRKRRAADRHRESGPSPHDLPEIGPTFQLGERTAMNILTNVLAGLIHFVGWLV